MDRKILENSFRHLDNNHIGRPPNTPFTIDDLIVVLSGAIVAHLGNIIAVR